MQEINSVILCGKVERVERGTTRTMELRIKNSEAGVVAVSYSGEFLALCRRRILAGYRNAKVIGSLRKCAGGIKIKAEHLSIEPPML